MVSDTKITVELEFDNTDFDTDTTLTFIVGAEAIAGSNNQGFTAQLPVTAIEKSNATVSISPVLVVSPAVGEGLRLSLNIKGGENVVGYQATVSFDPTALLLCKEYQWQLSASADTVLCGPNFRLYRPGTILRETWIWETTSVTITASTLAGAANGDGTLATLTFRGQRL